MSINSKSSFFLKASTLSNLISKDLYLSFLLSSSLLRTVIISLCVDVWQYFAGNDKANFSFSLSSYGCCHEAVFVHIEKLLYGFSYVFWKVSNKPYFSSFFTTKINGDCVFIVFHGFISCINHTFKLIQFIIDIIKRCCSCHDCFFFLWFTASWMSIMKTNNQK